MKIRLPYGRGEMEAEINDAEWIRTLDIAHAPKIENWERDVIQPIEAVVDRVRGKETSLSNMKTIVIVVSDSFRTTRLMSISPSRSH